jgi:FK506-binding nuclear protein
MVIVLATWSVVVVPGKKVTQEVYRDFKITNAALGANLEDGKARSTLKIKYSPPPMSDDEDDDEAVKKNSKKPNTPKTKEVALCSLTPGTVSRDHFFPYNLLKELQIEQVILPPIFIHRL